jgi:hypothetical protein
VVRVRRRLCAAIALRRKSALRNEHVTS